MNLLQWLQLFCRVRARTRRTPAALLVTALVGTATTCCRRQRSSTPTCGCPSPLQPRCRCR